MIGRRCTSEQRRWEFCERAIIALHPRATISTNFEKWLIHKYLTKSALVLKVRTSIVPLKFSTLMSASRSTHFAIVSPVLNMDLDKYFQKCHSAESTQNVWFKSTKSVLISSILSLASAKYLTWTLISTSKVSLPPYYVLFSCKHLKRVIQINQISTNI